MNVKTKLGPELVEGDVIKFWPTGERGMRVEKIMPYTGRYPNIMCCIAKLRGIQNGDEHRSCWTAIEHNARYELVPQ
jgi:hypothetical protein